ncbi:hypothetical protein FACS189451_08760 [Bacteroidia bacterium]|nr:hypothetical protein FACS189451_08760 [Bacteroidia bacterium]
MKKVVLLFCVLFGISNFSNAQEPLSFSKVIQTENISQDDVYNGVRTWFALAMKDANKVLVMDDKNAGILVGNTNIKYSFGKFTYSAYDGFIDFVIQVNIREGRFKVEIKNFSHKKSNPNASVPDFGLITTAEESPFNKGMNKKPNQNVWEDIKKKIEALSEVIFSQIESSAKSGAVDSGNDNW